MRRVDAAGGQPRVHYRRRARGRSRPDSDDGSHPSQMWDGIVSARTYLVERDARRGRCGRAVRRSWKEQTMRLRMNWTLAGALAILVAGVSSVGGCNNTENGVGGA